MPGEESLREFLRYMETGSRAAQAAGLASSDAYADEDEVLQPDQPSEEDERLFLGAVEEKTETVADVLGLEVEDLPLCGTSEAVDAELDRLFGVPSDIAPAPLSSEFVFHKTVEQCGSLAEIYRAFQAVVIDGQESSSVVINGEEKQITIIPGFGQYMLVDEKYGLRYGANKNNVREYPHLTASDLLIWVSKQEKTVGYILNGWSFVLKK